jgi:hypothetical protein
MRGRWVSNERNLLPIYSTSKRVPVYFTESPIKDGKCHMYWGEVQQSIMDALQDIVNGKTK